MSHISIKPLDKIFHGATGMMNKALDALKGGDYNRQQEARMRKTPEGNAMMNASNSFHDQVMRLMNGK